MQAALAKLGYHDIYHMTSILTKNPRDVDMWVRAFDAIYGGKGTFRKAEWDSLLGHCMAVTDTPCIDFTYELIDTYPDAKVILLTRNIDSWYESYMDTVGRYFVEYESRYHKWYSLQRYLMPSGVCLIATSSTWARRGFRSGRSKRIRTRRRGYGI